MCQPTPEAKNFRRLSISPDDFSPRGARKSFAACRRQMLMLATP
jgi:hypothetical protein